MENLPPFHLAIPTATLEQSRKFYIETFGCKEGRSSEHWVDLNFYGHQLVLHYKPMDNNLHYNSVDNHDVPIPHFGVVLKWEQWQELAERLKAKNMQFIIEPYIRFKGESGEQATMFFLDPGGNALEFKAFRDINQLFAK